MGPGTLAIGMVATTEAVDLWMTMIFLVGSDVT
jgi:hypothetical protein